VQKRLIYTQENIFLGKQYITEDHSRQNRASDVCCVLQGALPFQKGRAGVFEPATFLERSPRLGGIKVIYIMLLSESCFAVRLYVRSALSIMTVAPPLKYTLLYGLFDP